MRSEPYPLTAWQAAVPAASAPIWKTRWRARNSFSPATGLPTSAAIWQTRSAQFWDALDRIFALAADGEEAEARTQIRLSLQARQAALSTAVARLLVQNNESEQQAAARTQQIYAGVERNVYVFLAAMLVVIAADQPLPGAVQPPLFRPGGGAVGAAQRTGAAADLDAGEYVSLDLARTARRFRPDPDGHRRDAAARRPAAPRGCSPARRSAGSARDRADHARKGAVALAGAASGGAGRGRASRARSTSTCRASRSRPASRFDMRRRATAATLDREVAIHLYRVCRRR